MKILATLEVLGKKKEGKKTSSYYDKIKHLETYLTFKSLKYVAVCM